MIRSSQVGLEDATRLMIVLQREAGMIRSRLIGERRSGILQCTPLALYSSPHYDRVASKVRLDLETASVEFSLVYDLSRE